MASPPPSKPSRSRHIKAPAEKLARWARDIFSNSPPPSRSSTPTGSIPAAAFQQPPGLSTPVGGSVPPGLSNVSIPLEPSVSDNRNDESITIAESQEPPGLSTPVGTPVQPGLGKDRAPLETPVSDKGKDRLGVVWNGLQTALGVLKESSDVFPPLESAVGGLVACLNVIQVSR